MRLSTPTLMTLLSLVPFSLSAPNPHPHPHPYPRPLPQSHGSSSTHSPNHQPFKFTISALWAYIPSSPPSPSLAPAAPEESPRNGNASTPPQQQQQQQQSWIAFRIHDGGATALCSVFTEGALSGGWLFWGCERVGAGVEEVEIEGDGDGEGEARYWFSVSPGFGALSVKKGWWVGGTYTTGYATQATNWIERDQGEGGNGNVTVDEHGKLYSRWEAWEFEITRLVA